MSPIAVTFDYQPWEQFLVQRQLMRVWTWYVLYALAVGLPLLLLALTLIGSMLLPENKGFSFSSSWYLLVPPALAVVVLPMMQLYGAFKHVRGHHLPHRDHTVTLTDTGIEILCVAARVSIPWGALYRVAENPRFFLFYVRKNCAYYIPKRALTAQHLEAAIRECIRAHDTKAGLGGSAA